jgi:hypothetical protein
MNIEDCAICHRTAIKLNEVILENFDGKETILLCNYCNIKRLHLELEKAVEAERIERFLDSICKN